MRKNIKHIATLALLFVVVSCGFFIFIVSRHADVTACTSYITSVGAFLQRNAKTNNVIIAIGEKLGNKWRFLSESEYSDIAKELSKSNSIETKRGRSGPNKILFDYWEQHILIAGRKRNGTGPEFIVWSKGPDKIFRTADDISSPWKTNPPEDLLE